MIISFFILYFTNVHFCFCLHEQNMLLCNEKIDDIKLLKQTSFEKFEKELFLSPSGNDNQSCGENDPCRTIAHSIDIGKELSRIHLDLGNYSEISAELKHTSTTIIGKNAKGCIIKLKKPINASEKGSSVKLEQNDLYDNMFKLERSCVAFKKLTFDHQTFDLLKYSLIQAMANSILKLSSSIVQVTTNYNEVFSVHFIFSEDTQILISKTSFIGLHYNNRCILYHSGSGTISISECSFKETSTFSEFGLLHLSNNEKLKLQFHVTNSRFEQCCNNNTKGGSSCFTVEYTSTHSPFLSTNRNQNNSESFSTYLNACTFVACTRKGSKTERDGIGSIGTFRQCLVSFESCMFIEQPRIKEKHGKNIGDINEESFEDDLNEKDATDYCWWGSGMIVLIDAMDGSEILNCSFIESSYGGLSVIGGGMIILKENTFGMNYDYNFAEVTSLSDGSLLSSSEKTPPQRNLVCSSGGKVRIESMKELNGEKPYAAKARWILNDFVSGKWKKDEKEGGGGGGVGEEEEEGGGGGEEEERGCKFDGKFVKDVSSLMFEPAIQNVTVKKDPPNTNDRDIPLKINNFENDSDRASNSSSAAATVLYLQIAGANFFLCSLTAELELTLTDSSFKSDHLLLPLSLSLLSENEMIGELQLSAEIVEQIRRDQTVAHVRLWYQTFKILNERNKTNPTRVELPSWLTLRPSEEELKRERERILKEEERKKQKSINTALIIGSVVCTLVTVGVIVFMVVYMKRRRANRREREGRRRKRSGAAGEGRFASDGGGKYVQMKSFDENGLEFVGDGNSGFNIDDAYAVVDRNIEVTRVGWVKNDDLRQKERDEEDESTHLLIGHSETRSSSASKREGSEHDSERTESLLSVESLRMPGAFEGSKKKEGSSLRAVFGKIEDKLIGTEMADKSQTYFELPGFERGSKKDCILNEVNASPINATGKTINLLSNESFTSSSSSSSSSFNTSSQIESFETLHKWSTHLIQYKELKSKMADSTDASEIELLRSQRSQLKEFIPAISIDPPFDLYAVHRSYCLYYQLHPQDDSNSLRQSSSSIASSSSSSLHSQKLPNKPIQNYRFSLKQLLIILKQVAIGLHHLHTQQHKQHVFGCLSSHTILCIPHSSQRKAGEDSLTANGESASNEKIEENVFTFNEAVRTFSVCFALRKKGSLVVEWCCSGGADNKRWAAPEIWLLGMNEAGVGAGCKQNGYKEADDTNWVKINEWLRRLERAAAKRAEGANEEIEESEEELEELEEEEEEESNENSDENSGASSSTEHVFADNPMNLRAHRNQRLFANKRERERAEGDEKRTVTEKSDMFSFGTLIWEVLTGCVPFETLSSTDALDEIGTGERPDRFLASEGCKRLGLSEAEADVLLMLMDRCHEVEAEKRPSAKEAIESVNILIQSTK